MPRRVLVTGGAGFIGSNLCEFLIKKGFVVYCIDNLITGKKGNLRFLLKDKNFHFIKADIVEKRSLGVSFDWVFHLASIASPAEYQKYPMETAVVNSIGTLNVLEMVRKRRARVVIASTSEVYGDPMEHPQKEKYWGNVNSFGPRSCYDESKRFAETLAYVYLQKHNVDVRVVRIFNTYGPRMGKDDGRVVSNFINQAIAGKDLTVYGTGRQTRSLCYVTDMVDGIYKTMFARRAKGEVINLGNPEEYTIKQLAQKIKMMIASNSRVVYKKLPKDDPKQRRPDIGKAKRILGWKPKVGLEEGLSRTIAYYKSI